MTLMKISSLGILSSLFLLGCNKGPQECRIVKIQFSTTQSSFRSLDNSIVDKEVDYQKITLYFWQKAEDSFLAAPYQKTFEEGSDEMKQLLGNGYELILPTSVHFVSAVCNQKGKAETDILKLQGEDVFKKIPYYAPKTAIDESGHSGNRYHLTLNPTPHIARIEISGNIKMIANDKGEMLSPTWKIKLTGIYINNFYRHLGDKSRYRLTPDDYDMSTHIWKGHPQEMRDEGNLTEKFEKDSSIASSFYVWPGEVFDDMSTLEHVILRFDIEDHNHKQHTNRFITIGTFYLKRGKNALRKIEAGKVYRLNLSPLCILFKTKNDDPKDPDNPTHDRPEEYPLMLGEISGYVISPDEDDDFIFGRHN